MSDQPSNFELRIDGLRPDTVPMARLAEYISNLAKVLGCEQHVHFKELREGSLILAASIDESALDDVMVHLQQASKPGATKTIRKGFAEFNRLLRQDDASAELRSPKKGQLLYFPGAREELSPIYGPIREAGSLEGQIIGIGGRDETIHIRLLDEDEVYRCETRSIPLAQRLAEFLFGSSVRVQGEGTWRRKEDQQWHLETFRVQSFEPLDDTPLPEVVKRLRGIKSGWAEVDDPEAELRMLRYADEDE